MGRPFRYIQSVFNRGELSPRIIGRVDNTAYYSAVKYSQNMRPFPQGSIAKRTGTYYVANVKNSANATILIPFKFSTVQNYVIELGDQYMRFYRGRGVVESSPGVPYEVVTPWPSSVLRELKFVQSYDRLYVFHKDYQTRVITRTSDTSWTIDLLSFVEGPFLPTNTTATTINPSGTSGSITLTASAPLFTVGDVGRQFRIKHGASAWGWGTITGFTSSTVVNATVASTLGSTSVTATWALSYFGGSQGWPALGTIYEQRFICASTANYPATVFCSATGDFGASVNFAPSNTDGTVVDSNGFVRTIGDDQVNDIRWLSSGRTLMIGTAGGEHSMSGGTASSYAPLAPNNTTIKRESKTGSAQNVRAHRVGNAILYASKSGLKTRELYFDFGIDSYISRDVTIFNDHITYSGIVDMDFQDEPDPTLWCALSNGQLVGFTYERVQEVEGWHRHLLGGANAAVKSVACIPKPAGNGDDLWMIVQRTINGATVQTVEYLTDDFDNTAADKDDQFYVDCGATYNGYLAATLTPAATSGTGVIFTAGANVFAASMVGRQIRSGSARATIVSYISPTQVTADITVNFASTSVIPSGSWSVATRTVTGITWLENETVQVLADGAFAGTETVSSGSVTIDDFASIIHVGLPYIAEIHTLPVEAQNMGTVAGTIRRTHEIHVYFTNTIGLKLKGASNNVQDLVPFGGANHPLNQGPSLFSGIVSTEPPLDYDREGVLKLIHDWPTNIMVNYIVQEMSING